MELKFKVAARIAKPVHDVFEAVVDPASLSHYFTTGGAQGWLATGATVTWDFHDYPGAFPVHVIEVVEDERIVLEWAADEGKAPDALDDAMQDADYRTRVTMRLAAIDGGRTLVEISEEGWRDTQAALDASYGNCHGWTQMLCALKVWVEHGINLRTDFYK